METVSPTFADIFHHYTGGVNPRGIRNRDTHKVDDVNGVTITLLYMDYKPNREIFTIMGLGEIEAMIRSGDGELVECSVSSFAPRGSCDYCDRERENESRFFPSHNASRRCRSGGHNHCTCDACF